MPDHPSSQAAPAASPPAAGEEVFWGPATRGLCEQLARAAASDLPVLLEGEAGTGKHELARALHSLSPRAGRPLVVACSRSLTPERFERDLFGALAGEAPCPLGHREGLASLADGGTLVLEEVGDLPAGSQAALARFLDEPRIRPEGGAITRPVDLRIVSTSRRELRAEVRAGRFRADLYFRLRGILLRAPSLADRREDLPGLAGHLLARAARRQGKPVAGFCPEALELLLAQPFPGNLRELEAAVERAVARTPAGEAVAPEALAGEAVEPENGGGEPLRELRRRHEREMVETALAARGWNVSATARDLGISRVGLCKKIKTLGLRRPAAARGRRPQPEEPAR